MFYNYRTKNLGRALSWRGAHLIARELGVFETLLMSHDVIDETGLDPLFLLSPVHRERVRAQNEVIDESGGVLCSYIAGTPGRCHSPSWR